MYRCHTYICFVENQLAQGQIGISPLSKTLRRIMQHSPVRSIIIWSWKDHLASGLIEVTYPSLFPRIKLTSPKKIGLIKLVSPVAFAKAFNLATPINLLTHYAKGTPSFYFYKTSTAYRVTNSSLFHYVNTILFKLSFTVLFAIAKFIILSLRGWFPFIPTSFLSSYLFLSLIINLQDFHLF